MTLKKARSRSWKAFLLPAALAAFVGGLALVIYQSISMLQSMPRLPNTEEVAELADAQQRVIEAREGTEEPEISPLAASEESPLLPGESPEGRISTPEDQRALQQAAEEPPQEDRGAFPVPVSDYAAAEYAPQPEEPPPQLEFDGVE